MLTPFPFILIPFVQKELVIKLILAKPRSEMHPNILFYSENLATNREQTNFAGCKRKQESAVYDCAP